jgi:hypothetical protein
LDLGSGESLDDHHAAAALALVKKVVFDQVQCSLHEFHNPELDVCET